jgi:hypothetical protein
VTYLTRRLEEMAGRVNREQIAQIQAERNPNRSLRYLYEKVIGD